MIFTIQTHAAAGASRWIVELQGHNIEMAVVPREAMATVDRNRDLLDNRRWGRAGVYLLLGPPASPCRIYVGSSGDILARPRDRDHWLEKDWWTRAVLIFSDALGPGTHEQIERMIGDGLRAASPELVTAEAARLPSSDPDSTVDAGVRRALLPAVETLLHLFGVYVPIPDPAETP